MPAGRYSLTPDDLAHMRRVAAGLVDRQEVPDLVQDAAEKLVKAAPEIAGDRRKYLAVCVYQAFYKQLEVAAKLKRQSAGVCSIDEASPVQLPHVQPNQYHAASLGETLRTLDRLPRNWARAVLLAVDGLNPSEIAREMGCGRNSVYVWLANGRRVLGDPDLLGERITADSVLSRGAGAQVTRRGAAGYAAAA